MSGTPTYTNPPVVELVLGVQFSPLTKLTAGHYGQFWKELGPDWVDPADAAVLEDQFELFDRPRWSAPTGVEWRMGPVRLPGRFLITHSSKDQLIQVQATRFHLNWRKRDDSYPSYKTLIAQFEATFARFGAFAAKANLGPVLPNQWELTYIDAFPRGDYWETPSDWADVLPGLFGRLFPTDGLGLALEHRAAEWSYEIQPQRGRLHLAANPGRWGDDKRDCLLLHTTARGPLGPGRAETLRSGLDAGHDAAVGTFLRVAGGEVRRRWGEQP